MSDRRGQPRVLLLVGVLSAASAGLWGCEGATAPAELSSVADAPAHSDANWLRFPGTPRVDLLGEFRWRSARHPRAVGTSDSREPNMAMFVIPVVPEGWSPAQPVPLWLTSSASIVDPGPWLVRIEAHEGPFTGTRVDVAGREQTAMRTGSGWQKAIADAEAKHGIRSDPNAPIVSWPPRE